jgi:hypothetical protein
MIVRVQVIKGHVIHNSKEYAIGASFTCNKADGNHLLSSGFVKEMRDYVRNRKDDSELKKLQDEARAFGIETDGKDIDTLKAELEAFEGIE